MKAACPNGVPKGIREPKTPAMPSHPSTSHPPAEAEESSSYETSSDEAAPAAAKAGPAVAPALAAATPAPACRDMACGPDEPYREPRTPAMLDVACQTKESFFDRSVRDVAVGPDEPMNAGLPQETEAMEREKLKNFLQPGMPVAQAETRPVEPEPVPHRKKRRKQPKEHKEENEVQTADPQVHALSADAGAGPDRPMEEVKTELAEFDRKSPERTAEPLPVVPVVARVVSTPPVAPLETELEAKASKPEKREKSERNMPHTVPAASRSSPQRLPEKPHSRDRDCSRSRRRLEGRPSGLGRLQLRSAPRSHSRHSRAPEEKVSKGKGSGRHGGGSGATGPMPQRRRGRRRKNQRSRGPRLPRSPRRSPRMSPRRSSPRRPRSLRGDRRRDWRRSDDGDRGRRDERCSPRRSRSWRDRSPRRERPRMPHSQSPRRKPGKEPREHLEPSKQREHEKPEKKGEKTEMASPAQKEGAKDSASKAEKTDKDKKAEKGESENLKPPGKFSPPRALKAPGKAPQGDEDEYSYETASSSPERAQPPAANKAVAAWHQHQQQQYLSAMANFSSQSTNYPFYSVSNMSSAPHAYFQNQYGSSQEYGFRPITAPRYRRPSFNGRPKEVKADTKEAEAEAKSRAAEVTAKAEIVKSEIPEEARQEVAPPSQPP